MSFAAQDAPVPASSQEAFDLSRLDDPGAWHKRSRVLVDGPDGCIEVQGRVRLQFSLYSAGSLWSAGGREDIVAEGRFEGRLDHGVWTRLDTTWAEVPTGADITLEVDRFRPIVGRLPAREDRAEAAAEFREKIESRYSEDEVVTIEEEKPDSEDGSFAITKDETGLHMFFDGGGNETLGMLDEIIEDLEPDGTSTYVTWDEDTRIVELTEAVPIDGGGTMSIMVHFPEGEAPTRLDATFPKKVRFKEDGVRVTVREAQLHLRSKETDLGVVPGVEGMSTVVGFFGFTIGVDQRVAYERVRACVGGS